MTILIETYKDEHTTTAYYGYTLDDVTDISLSLLGKSLMFYSHNNLVASVGTKLIKRLEINEDGK